MGLPFFSVKSLFCSLAQGLHGFFSVKAFFSFWFKSFQVVFSVKLIFGFGLRGCMVFLCETYIFVLVQGLHAHGFSL